MRSESTIPDGVAMGEVARPDGSIREPDGGSTSSDVELWRRLRDGSSAHRAIEALYDRYAPLVFGLSLRILGDRQIAEDVTQEVFLALFEGRSYDETRGTFRAYLTVFTRSRAIDRLRRQRRAPQTGAHPSIEIGEVPETEGFSPLEHASVRENARVVSEALAKLNDRQRLAIELAYFQGLSQSEIATQLDEPLGTIKGLVRSALQAMRRTLGHGVE